MFNWEAFNVANSVKYLTAIASSSYISSCICTEWLALCTCVRTYVRTYIDLYIHHMLASYYLECLTGWLLIYASISLIYNLFTSPYKCPRPEWVVSPVPAPIPVLPHSYLARYALCSEQAS